LQEQSGKTKSCEIEALRAGGGQVEIKRKVMDFDEDLHDEFLCFNPEYRACPPIFGGLILSKKSLIINWDLSCYASNR
jgi:hypothetical protein